MILSEAEEKVLWKVVEYENELRDLIAAHARFDKIKAVRQWLRERFPEVADLPRAEEPRNFGEMVSPEFKIAREIVSLLSQRAE